MTLEEIATAIRNHVSDGLKGVSEFSYSIEQLEKEIATMRGSIIKQYKMQQVPINMKYLSQFIDGIPVVKKDLSKCSVWPSDEIVPGFEIPKLAVTSLDKAVEYLGGMNLHDEFHVYYSMSQIHNHKYRPYTKNLPYAFIDPSPNDNNNFDVFLFNGQFSSLQSVSMRAVFEDPHAVEIFKGRSPIDKTFEYPAPAWLVDEIIKQLTQRYVQEYRQMNIGYFNFPNDGTRKL